MSLPPGASPAARTGDLPARPTWVRWQIVALLVAYSFMTWFNRVSLPVAYTTSIQEQYGITPVEIGYVSSALLLAYTICMTPGGWLIDHAGPKAALVLMGFGSAVFVALTGLAGYSVLSPAALLILLLVIRALMGVCSAPIYPASSRLVSHWIPARQHTWANGLVQGAAAVGMACAFPLFGQLIDWFQWPSAFLWAGIFTAALALVWTAYAADYPGQHRFANEGERRLIEESAPSPDRRGDVAPRPAHAAAPAGWTFLLRDRSLMMLTLSYAAVGYVEYLYFFWIEHYFEKVLDLGRHASRNYASILLLAMAAGMVLGGWSSGRLETLLGKRRGRVLVPVVGMIAGAALLLLGVLMHETVWIVTLLALSLAAVGAVEAPVWTTAVELGGRRGGTAAGICNTGGNAGGLLAPVLTPLVSTWVSEQFRLREQAGWQWGIGLGALIGLLGAGLWWWIIPPGQARPAAEDEDEWPYEGKRPLD
jgi:MFS family permease